MRITIGDVVVDTEDAAEAAALITALRNGAPTPKQRKPERKPEPEPGVELGRVLYDTWNWLVENDSPEGAMADDVAAALNIEHGAANWRLNRLVNRGVAHRVRRGHFRAGEE